MDDPDLAVALLDTLGRVVRTLRQDAPSSDIGPGGLSTLVTLDQQGAQRIGALADAISVTAPSMTRIVNALEAEGLVTREADPVDGRAQVVVMTEDGRTLITTGNAAKLAALRGRLADLPADERERLAAALPALALLGGAALPAP
jgi:DNA-binding MarR family transcriptional regulator